MQDVNRLYDPIRKKWVDKTPEELIRQSLINEMVHMQGYPASLIAVEKELSQLPQTHPLLIKIPKRRTDIVVYAKNKQNVLKAVMIMECKALPLTPKFAQQVIGYNSFIHAPFIALANASHVLTGFFDQKNGIYTFKEGLLSFQTLLSYAFGADSAIAKSV